MTQNPREKRAANKKSVKGDVRLMLCAALFLGAVVLKTTDAPWTQALREQTAAVLRGGVRAQDVLQVAGKTLEDGNLTAVFALWDAEPQEDNGNEADEGSTAVYAESGYGEDELAARVESKFPKQEDQTNYVLSFETAQPVQGVRTSVFGERIHPISGEESFHYGLDIAADEGVPIAAFADGTVRETGFNTYGNYVIIDHADGFSTLYAHCHTVGVVKGQQVRAGETIAAVGATGNATGNHLHFEIWRNGKALDPALYLAA